MTPEDQVAFYIEKLNQARQAYERDHPDWRLECLFWILMRGLTGLRHDLEADSDQTLWQHPFVELHFPIECQWQNTENEVPFVLKSGDISEDNLDDDELMVDTLAKIMVRQMEIETLQEVTHDAVYVHEGETYRTMFSAEDVERLEAIRSEEERTKEVRALLRPFSFGGGTIDVPEGFEGGDAISEWTATQVSEIKPPLVMVPTPVGTQLGQVAVIFEVHPMVADVTKKIAYFPLTVGLTLFPEQDEGELENPAPGWLRFFTWSAEERERLWITLFAAIAESLAQLGPIGSKELETAILTVNAEIQVKQGEGESLDELQRRALEKLQRMGTVVKYDARLSSGTQALSAMDGMRGYFVQGDSPAGFVEAMRRSPQELKLWCSKQSPEVLRQAKLVLHVHHTVWHEVLKEEIEARVAADARSEAKVADARMVRLTAWGVAAALLAIVVGIVVAKFVH